MDTLDCNESETSDSKSHLARWLAGAFESPSTDSISDGPSPSPPQKCNQQQQTSSSTKKLLTPGAVMEQSERFRRQIGQLPDSQCSSNAHVSNNLLGIDASNTSTNIAKLGPEKSCQSNTAYRPSTVYDRPDVQSLLHITSQSPLPIHCPRPIRVIRFTPRSPPLDQPLLAPAPLSISHPWEYRAHRHLVVPRQRVHYMNQILSSAMHGTHINPDGGVTVYYC